MSSLLRTRLSLPTLHQISPKLQHLQQRHFIPGLAAALTSFGGPLHFHANRVLSYPQAALFDIISNIAAYPKFIPGLLDAQILSYTAPKANPTPDSGQKRLPALASLTVGVGDVAKLGLPMSKASFVSHVYCVPSRGVVEAVAGEERGSVVFTPEELREFGYGVVDERNVGSGVEDMGPELFRFCRTRWKLADAGSGRTEVDLRIEIEWKNALLARMTQAAAPAMAESVVAAFEGRARDLLRK